MCPARYHCHCLYTHFTHTQTYATRTTWLLRLSVILIHPPSHSSIPVHLYICCTTTRTYLRFLPVLWRSFLLFFSPRHRCDRAGSQPFSPAVSSLFNNRNDEFRYRRLARSSATPASLAIYQKAESPMAAGQSDIYTGLVRWAADEAVEVQFTVHHTAASGTDVCVDYGRVYVNSKLRAPRHNSKSTAAGRASSSSTSDWSGPRNDTPYSSPTLSKEKCYLTSLVPQRGPRWHWFDELQPRRSAQLQLLPCRRICDAPAT